MPVYFATPYTNFTFRGEGASNRRRESSTPHRWEVKSKVLADAGISTTTANRYEQLVGRPDQQLTAFSSVIAGVSTAEVVLPPFGFS
jgi:hypothetical protein